MAFSSAAYSVGEASASVTLTATLSATSAQTVTVAYATANGTALAGSDYVSASGTSRTSRVSGPGWSSDDANAMTP